MPVASRLNRPQEIAGRGRNLKENPFSCHHPCHLPSLTSSTSPRALNFAPPLYFGRRPITDRSCTLIKNATCGRHFNNFVPGVFLLTAHLYNAHASTPARTHGAFTNAHRYRLHPLSHCLSHSRVTLTMGWGPWKTELYADLFPY